MANQGVHVRIVHLVESRAATAMLQEEKALAPDFLCNFVCQARRKPIQEHDIALRWAVCVGQHRIQRLDDVFGSV